MDLSSHTFHSLFDQLGLPSTESEIQRFIAEHRPLSDAVALADASFWTPAQAQFLREEIARMPTGPRWSTSSTWRCAPERSAGFRAPLTCGYDRIGPPHGGLPSLGRFRALT